MDTPILLKWCAAVKEYLGKMEKRDNMGGYGSGGHNKIKGDITEYVRVDKFYC